MLNDDFAIFICTHGRPDKQTTYDSLKKSGYTGKVYMVVDDTDSTIEQYVDNYGADMLIVFNKQYYIDNCDVGSRPPNFKTILYAKNTVEDIASYFGLKAFVIADDDVSSFRLRAPKDDESLYSANVQDMDIVVSEYCKFMVEQDFAALGFGHFAVYFNGARAFDSKMLLDCRVPYNFVFRNTKYHMDWVSSFGEDIITAMNYNKIGYRMLDIPYVRFETVPPSKATSGGMVEVYKSISDYKLCFYNLMYNPSGIKLRMRNGIWNAQIQRASSFPMIVSDKYRKES